MVSTFTPNIQLEEPARGDLVGVWDTPVNGNMTALDSVVGANAIITLNNSNVVLSAAQFKSAIITFVSTLTGSVTITFPTTFTKPYIIQNLCTGSSAFTITLATTTAGGNFIGAKPGDPFDVFSDGSTIKYMNLGLVGSYWDYAGSSVPNWVTACAVPPFLNCDGTSFSSGAYPLLATILGGNTLPDARGRASLYLNGGTGRLTSSGAGIDGNTRFAAGGTNGVTLGTSHIPTLTSVNLAQSITVTPPSGQVPYGIWNGWLPAPTTGTFFVPNTGSNPQNFTGSFSGSNSISVAYTNSSQAVINSPVPGLVAGIRMIRAA